MKISEQRALTSHKEGYNPVEPKQSHAIRYLEKRRLELQCEYFRVLDIDAETYQCRVEKTRTLKTIQAAMHETYRDLGILRHALNYIQL